MSKTGIIGERMKHLDALRAFAIACVMCEHYSGVSDKIPVGAGRIGVGLFFVLSGFLITGILLEAKARAGTNTWGALIAFYMRRFARLMPAYYFVLLILAVLAIDGIESSWPWHAAYLSNVYAAIGGKENVFWTLAVEEQFYLLWPFALILLPMRHVFTVAISLIVVAFLLKIGMPLLGMETDFRLLPFQFTLLGAGCAAAALSVRDGKAFQMGWFTPAVSNRLLAAGIFGFGLAIALWFAFGGKGLARSLFNDILLAPGALWLVLSGAKGFTQPLLKHVFDNKILQYIGIISYGIYLTHNFVPKILDNYVGVDGVAKLVLSLFITIAFCAASFRFLEKPIIDGTRKLTTRVDPSRDKLAPAQ